MDRLTQLLTALAALIGSIALILQQADRVVELGVKLRGRLGQIGTRLIPFLKKPTIEMI
jgi:hypothetical protein